MDPLDVIGKTVKGPDQMSTYLNSQYLDSFFTRFRQIPPYFCSKTLSDCATIPVQRASLQSGIVPSVVRVKEAAKN